MGAVTALKSMVKKGVHPDTTVVTALIDTCCKNNKVNLAQKIFDEIFGGPSPLLAPDELTLKVLFDGYLKIEPPAWDMVVNIIQMAETKFDCPSTIISYNSLLEACSRNNDMERAYAMIDIMKLRGIDPNKHTFNSVRT